jgi:hypothetical protein
VKSLKGVKEGVPACKRGRRSCEWQLRRQLGEGAVDGVVLFALRTAPGGSLRADARFLKTTSILFCSLIHTNTSTTPPTVYPSIRICTHPHSLPTTKTHINSTITMATEVRDADSAPIPPLLSPGGMPL